MEAGGCRGEDVFGGEVGEGGKEGEDGGDEEDGERFGDWWRDWLHGDRGSDRFDLLRAIPGYELRDEEGSHGKEESFEAVGMSVQIGLVGRDWGNRYERSEGYHDDDGEYTLTLLLRDHRERL